MVSSTGQSLRVIALRCAMTGRPLARCTNTNAFAVTREKTIVDAASYALVHTASAMAIGLLVEHPQHAPPCRSSASTRSLGKQLERRINGHVVREEAARTHKSRHAPPVPSLGLVCCHRQPQCINAADAGVRHKKVGG
jgi:hypothetical protein